MDFKKEAKEVNEVKEEFKHKKDLVCPDCKGKKLYYSIKMDSYICDNCKKLIKR